MVTFSPRFSQRLRSSLMCLAVVATTGFAAQSSFAQYYTPGYSPAYTPNYAPVYPQPQPQQVVRTYAYALTPDQLDQLMAPIALYPDPLLADVLASATYLQQVNEAAISLRANPNIDDNYINAQAWPQSVKVLAHYPEIITLMTSQPDWTETIGAAFVEQQGDVMMSIQRLRSQAQAVGALYTTPQQQVVVNNNYIQVLPAQPGVIYVPQYDPRVVYVRGRDSRDAIRFGGGLKISPNFRLDFDWDHHALGVGVRWDSGRPVRDSNFRDWHRDDKFGGRPTIPPPVVNRFNNDARRGYVPTPPPPVFNSSQNRSDVNRADQRAQQSRPGLYSNPNPVYAPQRDNRAPGGPGVGPGRPGVGPGGPGGPGGSGRPGDRGDNRFEQR